MTGPDVAGPRSFGRPLRFALIAVILLPVALTKVAVAQEWTTEPQYEIGSPAAGATLQHVRQVRVNRDGSRVYVHERQGYGSAVNRGRLVTVWSPDGSLLVEIGPGEVTRDFGVPLGIRLARTGFWVHYEPLFVLFSDGGSLLAQVGRPDLHAGDVNILAILEDRSFIGLTRLTRLGRRLGWSGGEPDLDDHLLHLLPTGDGWTWDTIADMDRRNVVFGLRAMGRSSPIPTDHFSGQPYPDSDLFYLDVVSGVVGIVVRNRTPGEVGIHEITIHGDTTWRRNLDLPSVPIPPEVREEAVEDVVESITSDPVAPGDALARLPLDTLRRMARHALHLPSHHPPVTRAIATASGEIWFRSAEPADTLVVWYSLPRGDASNAPRRILLPAWYRLSDATDSHVWGFRAYEEGAAPVLGRKLIPPTR